MDSTKLGARRRHRSTVIDYDQNNPPFGTKTHEHAALLERMLRVALDDLPLKALLERCLDELMSVSWLSLLPKSGIFLKDHVQDQLTLIAERNLGPQITSLCSRVAYGHCLCGRAAVSQTTLHANCVDHRHETQFEGMEPHGHYNVPIKSADGLIGVLVVYLPHGHQRDTVEVAFLEGFADLLALIVTGKSRETQLQETHNELRSSHAAIDGVMKSITRHAIFSQRDADGRITDVNKAFCDISGYSKEELIGARKDIVSSGHHSTEFWQSFWGTIKSGEAWRGEIKNRSKEGRIYWLDSIVMPIRDGEGEINRFLSLCLDVTEQKRAEEALSRMGRLVEHASSEVYVFGDERFEFLLVNRGARDNLGYSQEEIAELNPFAIMPSIDRDTFQGMVEPLVSGAQDLLRFETEHQRKDGSRYPVDINLHYARDEHPPIFLAFVQDITERKQGEEEIRKLALFDPLTGLANRAHLISELDAGLVDCAESSGELQLVYMDLDRFKQINDTLGHAAGDHVLWVVADRLHAVFGLKTVLSRLGGDEFVAVLPQTSKDEMLLQVDELLEMFEHPIMIDEMATEVGISIGTASYPEDGKGAEELLQSADIAMYHAKVHGFGHCHYEHRMRSNLSRRQRVSERLTVALAANDLSLVYQPFVDLSTGQLSGAETLLRWNDAELGPVSPIEIISVAEDYRLLRKLSCWIFDQACRQMRHWLDQGCTLPRRVAINATAGQLEDGTIVEDLLLSCETHGVSPSQIEIEITEGEMMKDPDASMVVLNQLKEHDVEVAIDDFGTGYSSLERLKQLNVQKLKIDLSFVRDMADDVASRQIIAATIGLASGLGLRVLAEGVETTKQADWLRKLDCNEAQGFLFDRPLPPERFAEVWLETSHVPASGT